MIRTSVFLLMALLTINLYAEEKVAIFAGGCFWCMEKPFDKVDGVSETISGYTGGHTNNPTYESTSTGKTGHYEALKITYDSNKVSYEELLNVFWKNIDPFDARGQFCDKGPQYRSGIFAANDEEKELAEASKQALQSKLGDKANIVTQVLPTATFYDAEDYHQNYYKKNPLRYKYYRFGCGRDARLEEVNKIIYGK